MKIYLLIPMSVLCVTIWGCKPQPTSSEEKSIGGAIRKGIAKISGKSGDEATSEMIRRVVNGSRGGDLSEFGEVIRRGDLEGAGSKAWRISQEVKIAFVRKFKEETKIWMNEVEEFNTKLKAISETYSERDAIKMYKELITDQSSKYERHIYEMGNMHNVAVETVFLGPRYLKGGSKYTDFFPKGSEKYLARIEAEYDIVLKESQIFKKRFSSDFTQLGPALDRETEPGIAEITRIPARIHSFIRRLRWRIQESQIKVIELDKVNSDQLTIQVENLKVPREVTMDDKLYHSRDFDRLMEKLSDLEKSGDLVE